MYITKVNFISNHSFKGEYDNRVQALRRNYNAISWWWSGEEEAKKTVSKNMRDEIKDLEKKVVKKQVECTSLSASLKDLKEHHSSVLSKMNSSILTLQNQYNNNLDTIESLEQTLSNLNSMLSSIKQSNKNYCNTISNQENTKQEIKNKIIEIKQEQKKQELKINENLRSKLKKLDDSQKQKLQELEKQQVSSIKTPNIMNREINCPKAEGFGAIAGYKEEKEEIKNAFGKAVVLERYGKTVEVPNGILLFGPDSDFNNNFAHCIAKQYNLKFKDLDYVEDEVERIKTLRNEASIAQKEYEKSGIRTLIFIKDFENFAPKGSRIVGPMKSFMDKVSPEHHATIIATTTKPDVLDDILLRTSRFQLKLGIPPINETNLIALIKSIFDAEVLTKVNIKSLVGKILSLQTDGFYSIKSLKKLIQNIVPDISSSAIKDFENQVKFIKRL